MAAALLVCLAGAGGCGPARSQPPAGGDPQDRDRLGYDPARAFVQFDQLDAAGVVIVEPTAQAKPLSPRGARRVAKAARLGAQQRYTEAGLELERALQSDPDSPELHLQLARVLRAAGNTNRCRTHLWRALSLNPNDLVVHYLLALAAIDDQDRECAVRELRTALRCSNAAAVPDVRALVLYRLAEVLAGDGYLTAGLELYRAFEAAIAELETGGDTDGELATLLQVTGGRAGRPISVIHEQLGEFGQAADALAGALQGQTADGPTRTRLTRLLSRAGRHEEAVAQARQLVAEDASAVDLLLETYRRAGRPDGALDELADMAVRKPDDTRYLLSYVAALESLGRGAQAEAQLEQFARTHPERLEVRWRLFDLYAARSAWSEALAVAAAAVAADPSASAAARAKFLALSAENGSALLEAASGPSTRSAAASYLLGSLALHLGRPEQAAALLGEAIGAEGGFTPAVIELAAVYNAQYRWSEAISLLGAQLQGEDRSARVEWLAGQAYDGLDDHEQAALRYNAASRLNPQDTRPLRALGKLYERTGDTLRAVRQYRTVLDSNPLDEESREALFGLYVVSGDRQAAAEQLDELRRIKASPNRLARCQAFLANDPRAPDFDRLRKTLMETMARTEPDARSLTYIGYSYLNEARYDRALEVLERAVALAPDDIDAVLARGTAYRMALQFGRSADTLRGLLRRHPNRRQWIQGLIEVLVVEQDFDGALAVIERQLTRPKPDTREQRRYREKLLDVLQAARRFDERVARVEGWLEADPEDTRLRAWLFEAYRDAQRPADALSLVQSWYEQEPDNDALRGQLAALLVEDGQAERACQLVLDALGADPDNEGLQRLLIGTLGTAGRHDDALELATNCLVDAHDAEAFEGLMLSIYSTAGRHDEAVDLLGDLIHRAESGESGALGLDRGGWQRLLAAELLEAERYNEAQARLSRWIERSRDPAVKFEYLQQLSTCHQMQGQFAQSVDVLEQAYALRPLDPGINNNVAYHWADAGIRLAEAEKRLRYAVAQQPRSDAFLDSLGWVLYKKGDFAGAIKWLTLAVGAGSGDDPVIRDHLGDVYWRAGDRPRAVENWQAAERRAVESLAEGSRLSAAEHQRVLEGVRKKLAELERGESPEAAPLGQGVKEQSGAPTS